MTRLHFNNTIKESDLTKEVSAFILVVGFSKLKNEMEKLEKRMRINSFARYLLAEKHDLGLSIWRIIQSLRTYGRLLSFENLQYNRAYSFMFVFNRVYPELSLAARNNLVGRFLSGLDEESDLDSIEHEMKTVGHFVNLGGEIECHDLEEGGYDFLCSRSGVDVELECKSISVDKGRQIHQHDLLRLSDQFNRDLITMAPQPQGFGAIVSARIPARLSRIPTELKALATDIERAFESGESSITEQWEITTSRFLITNSPFDSNVPIDKETTQDFVRALAPGSRGQILISATPGVRAAIVDLQSAKPDRYPEQVYRELKAGADQFSKSRPSVLVAAITNLSSKDLELIGYDPSANGFAQIATRLLGSEKRQHIHTVMFTGDAALRKKFDGSVSSTGSSLNFQNPNHPLRMDPRLRFTL